MIVAKILVHLLRKVLTKFSFLWHEDPDGTVTEASPIASLVKAVLTIFVSLAVLQHFGLTDVLALLRGMLGKFTAAIPNIVGAGVIAYAGWIIAKVVSELVGVALGKVDNQFAERTGNDDVKISKFGSAFLFIAILLPIVVAALGVLNIPAISDPASAMIEQLMAAVPNIIGAAIILLVGAVILLIGNFLSSLAYNKLSAGGASNVVANIARFAVLGLVLAMGLRAMGLADNSSIWRLASASSSGESRSLSHWPSASVAETRPRTSDKWASKIL